MCERETTPYEAGIQSGLSLALGRMIEAGIEVDKRIVAAVLGYNAEAESEEVKRAKESESKWYQYYTKKVAELDETKKALNEKEMELISMKRAERRANGRVQNEER